MSARAAARGSVALLAALVLALLAATPALGTTGVFARGWGQDVDASNPGTGAEICTVATNCQAGSIGTIAGAFSGPAGVGVDGAGNIYVSDGGNNRIEKFDSSGQFLRMWGKDVDSADPGTGFEICTVAADCKAGTEGSLGGEMDDQAFIAVTSAGDVYTNDDGNARIQEFDSSGNFLRAWGKDVDSSNAGTGPEICAVAADCQEGSVGALGGEFTAADMGIAVQPNGDVVVADSGNERVDQFDPTGGFVRAWGKDVDASNPGSGVCTVAVNCRAGSTGQLGGEFNTVFGIGTDTSGDVFATEFLNQRVQEFGPTGTFVRAWGKNVDGSNPSAGFEICTVAADCQAGTAGALGGEFLYPLDVKVDGAGHVYVAEQNQNRVQEFDSSGNFLRTWGKDVDSSDAGTGSEICTVASDCQAGSAGSLGGEFAQLQAIAVDADGNLLTVDALNERVDEFAAVDPPVVSAVSPASPANDNSPKISGSAPNTATVTLYTNTTCTGTAAGTGSAADFTSSGLTVAVADDSTTTFYATATDAAGSTSPCSPTSVTYIEDSTPPGAPAIASTSPASPGATTNLNVIGSGEANSTVTLYTDAACGGTVAASGSAADFSSPGIAVTVAPNSTTTFYATATDLAGNVSPCSTGLTYVEQEPTAAPLVQTLPSTSGTAKRGQLLTADHGTWSQSPTSYAYAWLRCDANGGACQQIATGSMYTLTDDDVGHTMRVEVTAHNDIGDSQPAQSDPTKLVSDTPPVNATLPDFTPSSAHDDPGPKSGDTLSGDPGGWSGSPTSFSYQWRQCDGSFNNCTDIAGATGSTYVIAPGDAGHTIRLRVIAHNDGGDSAPADSNATEIVQYVAPPGNVSPPSIAGAGDNPQDGMTLTAGHGAWTGAPTSYAYQWRRCSVSISPCADIAGATSLSYTLVVADHHSTIVVRVTASNGGGSTSADSDQTAVVHTSLRADFTWTPGDGGVVTCPYTAVHFDGSLSTGPSPIVKYWFYAPDDQAISLFGVRGDFVGVVHSERFLGQRGEAGGAGGGGLVGMPPTVGSYPIPAGSGEISIGPSPQAVRDVSFAAGTETSTEQSDYYSFVDTNLTQPPIPVTLIVEDANGDYARVAKSVSFSPAAWPLDPPPGCPTYTQVRQSDPKISSFVDDPVVQPGDAITAIVGCGAAASCAGILELTTSGPATAADLARASRRKHPTLLAEKVFRIPARHTQKIRVRLTRVGRALFRHRRAVRVTERVILLVPSKNAVRTKHFTLRVRRR